MKFQRALSVIGIMSGVVMAAQTASAAGFYIQEQSARQQGDAFAGAAANPQDASTLFNNPAGMTELSGPQIAGDISVIIPHADLTNRGTNILGGPVAGNDGGDPFSATPVPSAYIAMPIQGGTWWAGLALTAPFGLTNQYNNTWFGRYNSTESVLTTEDIAPSVAVKVTDALSLGAGIDFQHAHAELDQKYFTGGPDGTIEVNGNSWKTGFNVGALWKVDPATNVGLHYRSAITQDIGGTLVVTGVTTGTHASAELKLPDIVEFGATHQLTSQLKLLGSINWFDWSRFNQIKVNSALGSTTIPTAWRDTWSAAIGAEWKQDEKWTYRGGFQWDETPTNGFRDTRIPDSNRFWVSLGASYAVTPAFNIDGAVSHLFMPDAGINATNSFGGGPPVDTIAVSKNYVNIVSMQGVWKF
jgi:long-chain fatty acid transport protein